MKGLLANSCFLGLMAAQPSFACDEIPGEFLSYMEALETPLTPISNDTFSSSIREYVETPGCVIGDFRGLQNSDYALLVKNVNNRVFLAVIFIDEFEISHYKYQHPISTVNEGSLRRYVYIKGIEPGTIKGAAGSLDLKNTGIHLSTDKSSILFYWDAGAIQKFWTAH